MLVYFLPPITVTHYVIQLTRKWNNFSLLYIDIPSDPSIFSPYRRWPETQSYVFWYASSKKGKERQREASIP